MLQHSFLLLPDRTSSSTIIIYTIFIYVILLTFSFAEVQWIICSSRTSKHTSHPIYNVFLIFLGRYDLSMPEMKCEACKATWSAGVDDLVRNDYWPATLHFSTVYSTDVFHSYEELKMAAPGLSCQAFLRMLDQRTVRFGRVSISGGNHYQLVWRV